MKTSSFLSINAPAMIVCACSGILPGVGILAPASMAGFGMDYSDLHGSYKYSFSADGTYRADIHHASGSRETTRSGTWKWTRKSPSDAVLVLDGAKTLNLKFTTFDHANGTVEGDLRLYAFEFEKM